MTFPIFLILNWSLVMFARWASSKSVGKSLEFCRRHQFCRQHFLILDSIKYKILQIRLRKQIQVMDVLHLFHRDWKVTFMWNFEELLCVLVPSKGIFRECQNYATTLWKARSKGKLCYQHPALAENKNRAEITSKSHSNEVRGGGWFGKNTPRWNIYLARWTVTFGQAQNKSTNMMSSIPFAGISSTFS